MKMKMDDFQVKITEVHLVSPADPTERCQLPFTTFDLMQKRDSMPYLQRVAFYESTGKDADLLVRNMKEGLAKVLVDFYPFAGRISFSGGGMPELDCNDHGVELSVAEANASLEELDTSQYSPLFKKLILRGNYEETTMTGTAPLFAAQVTKFKCGAVSVAWSFDHLAVDGIAMMHFITSWAEASSGKPISKPPVHDRYFERRNKDLAAKVDDSAPFQYTFVDPTAGVESRIFSFDEDEVEKMKKLVLEGNSDQQENGEHESFTTYEAVAAHFWVELCRARDLPKSQTTRAQIAVNCRPKIVPPVPQEYFGNVVLPGLAVSTIGELTAPGSKAVAARLLKKSIRSFGMEEIRSQIQSYHENYRNKNPMAQGLTDGVDIFFGSSLRHPLYEVDFGWGKPVAVRHGRFLWDGFCFFDPSPRGGRSMDATVHLPPPTMAKFAATIKMLEP
ncbi:shikimate O-hydroxycinnamoyltransferase [Selaginella moellendorffii]|nr:shikimate O-hydroxycinnamoyltransferase [Selaginella moellendorffii]|eukprot:XP_002969199.2 shikimate O-hydroxycinnamoyltransferase [Selaginella moellendorffii]